MKKGLALLLLICLVLGTGTGFAYQEPREPMELDSRVSEFFVGEFWPGDIKYLADGNIVLQTCDFDEDPSSMVVLKVNPKGEPIDGMSAKLDWVDGYNLPFFISFLIEDVEGNIYTAGEEVLVQILPDFSEVLPLMGFPNWWFDVESKDRVMINLIRGYSGPSDLAALAYEVGQSPADFNPLDGISSAIVSEMMGIENGEIMGADFGDTAEEIYMLLNSGSQPEGMDWTIGKFSMGWDGDYEEKHLKFELDEVIEINNGNKDFVPVSLEYDGQEFQVLSTDGPGGYSEVARISRSGEIVDSVALPGFALSFDTKGNETIVSVFNDEDSRQTGYYRIEWGGKSTGSPKSLIFERSFGGKTTATFRDGGYGLLKSEDPETGAIDYLAPLKSEEKEIRLRMPLCDVMDKVGGDAQNLEILYGEDRILIPMTALAVQELLVQMPCETDATVEIHLVRGEDGSVKVTAELFVVEKVDDMTKVVHRLPIQLP